MNGRLATAALAILIVVALAALGRQLPAQGQRQEPPRWQYMVVSFHGETDKQTKLLNDLAEQGWEYVGLVVTPGGGAAGGHVAFKRPKKFDR
jgi:hypothetical protein